MSKKRPKSKKTDTTQQTMPVTIVLGTHSTNPEFNGDCDYAVVRLAPGLMDQIRQRVELARQAGHQDNDLYELYFWDGTAEFYGCELVEACQEAVGTDQAAQDWLTGLEQNGHALMPVTANLATCEVQRVECAQMIIRRSPSPGNPQYEIAWTASPKHSDVYVTTGDLPVTVLEDYLRNGKVP